MALRHEAEQELERRGPMAVRLLLMNPNSAGFGPSAIVHLGTQGADPAREDVERWLATKEAEAEAEALGRYQQSLEIGREGVRWARYAFFAAMAGLIISIIALIAK